MLMEHTRLKNGIEEDDTSQPLKKVDEKLFNVEIIRLNFVRSTGSFSGTLRRCGGVMGRRLGSRTPAEADVGFPYYPCPPCGSRHARGPSYFPVYLTYRSAVDRALFPAATVPLGSRRPLAFWMPYSEGVGLLSTGPWDRRGRRRIVPFCPLVPSQFSYARGREALRTHEGRRC